MLKRAYPIASQNIPKSTNIFRSNAMALKPSDESAAVRMAWMTYVCGSHCETDCIQFGSIASGYVMPQKIMTTPRTRNTKAFASFNVMTTLAKAKPSPYTDGTAASIRAGS